MSVASLVVMLASARMPQIVALLLSLAVVIAVATWLALYPMMPVASGVRFEVWTFLGAPPTVVVTTFPPWNAFVASMCSGFAPVTVTEWQVAQASVARYLPLAGPVARPAEGKAVGSTAAHSGALGWTSYGAVLACTVCEAAGTVRR